MINLIKNEFIKIFKKKNIYILLIITLGFTILNNIIYKNITTNFFDSYEATYINQIKEELKDLDLNNASQRDEYINLKTEIDVFELKSKYKKDSWQVYVIDYDVANIIMNLNNAKYNKYENDTTLEEQDKYNEILNYLNNKTWKEYTKYKLEQKNNELTNISSEIMNSEEIKIELENEIYRLNMRLEKNIPYKNDYLNTALEEYNKSFTISLSDYLDKQKNELKENYDEYIAIENYKQNITHNEENKYMIENKIDLNNTNTLRYGLLNTLTNNTIFILIITIMISGTIVASEFDKGTIKSLLIRPYSRTKILLSKFIVSISILFITIISTYIMEFIIGSIFFGFSDLNIPIIVYNTSTEQIMHIGLFKYVIDMVLTTLPQYILLLTLSFAISTIICNSATAIAIPIIGSFVSEIINSLMQVFKLDFLKYFVTLHWDLSQYLYGSHVRYEGFNMLLSIIICLIYFIIIIVPTFIIFKKKNIKNI